MHFCSESTCAKSPETVSNKDFARKIESVPLYCPRTVTAIETESDGTP